MHPKMSAAAPATGPAIHPLSLHGRAFNRKATATRIGEVLALDLRDSAAATTSFTPGDAGASCWGNVVLPAGSDLSSGILVVVLEVVPVGAICKVQLCGIVNALCVRGAGDGAVAAGDPLVVDIEGHLDATVAAGEKYVAKFCQAGATVDGTDEALFQVIFDGWNGFGVFSAS